MGVRDLLAGGGDDWHGLTADGGGLTVAEHARRRASCRALLKTNARGRLNNTNKYINTPIDYTGDGARGIVKAKGYKKAIDI